MSTNATETIQLETATPTVEEEEIVITEIHGSASSPSSPESSVIMESSLSKSVTAGADDPASQAQPEPRPLPTPEPEPKPELEAAPAPVSTPEPLSSSSTTPFEYIFLSIPEEDEIQVSSGSRVQSSTSTSTSDVSSNVPPSSSEFVIEGPVSPSSQPQPSPPIPSVSSGSRQSSRESSTERGSDRGVEVKDTAEAQTSIVNGGAQQRPSATPFSSSITYTSNGETYVVSALTSTFVTTNSDGVVSTGSTIIATNVPLEVQSDEVSHKPGPLPPQYPEPELPTNNGKPFFSQPGAVAGVFVAALFALGACFWIGVLVYRHRRSMRAQSTLEPVRSRDYLPQVTLGRNPFLDGNSRPMSYASSISSSSRMSLYYHESSNGVKTVSPSPPAVESTIYATRSHQADYGYGGQYSTDHPQASSPPPVPPRSPFRPRSPPTSEVRPLSFAALGDANPFSDNSAVQVGTPSVPPVAIGRDGQPIPTPHLISVPPVPPTPTPKPIPIVPMTRQRSTSGASRMRLPLLKRTPAVPSSQSQSQSQPQSPSQSQPQSSIASNEDHHHHHHTLASHSETTLSNSYMASNTMVPSPTTTTTSEEEEPPKIKNPFEDAEESPVRATFAQHNDGNYVSSPLASVSQQYSYSSYSSSSTPAPTPIPTSTTTLKRKNTGTYRERPQTHYMTDNDKAKPVSGEFGWGGTLADDIQDTVGGAGGKSTPGVQIIITSDSDSERGFRFYSGSTLGSDVVDPMRSNATAPAPPAPPAPPLSHSSTSSYAPSARLSDSSEGSTSPTLESEELFYKGGPWKVRQEQEKRIREHQQQQKGNLFGQAL